MKSDRRNDKTSWGESARAHRRPNPSKLSRREWLARLGEGAAFFGLSCAAWDSGRVRGWASESPASIPKNLPPGLYRPSFDCLTHAIQSSGRYHTIPAGVETDYVEPRRGPYAPKFFTEAEFRIVRRLVREVLGAPKQKSAAKMGGVESSSETCEEIAEWIDLTVGESEAVRAAARNISPQHCNLAVHYYGAEAVRKMETAHPQETWRAGLRWLAAESTRRYSRPLSSLRKQELRQLLESISDARPMAAEENEGKQFFMLLKAEVIRGYYTSQRGLQELGYKGNGFYAASPGCPKHKKTPATSLARSRK